MAHYYKNKYRVESARLAGWDYRASAHYFITICTEGHKCSLAKIIRGIAFVSPLGMILAEEWWRTPYVRAYVELDVWQVMPNHFHGILVITEPEVNSEGSLQTPGLKAASVGSIIGQIKSVCTKRIRDLGESDFGWQERFHDHIIRDEDELKRIRSYIIGNPGKWHEDRYYRDNV